MSSVELSPEDRAFLLNLLIGTLGSTIGGLIVLTITQPTGRVGK